MKIIICRTLFAILISTLSSPTQADENTVNDNFDLSNPDQLLQVHRLVSPKSSSLDFGHDWMASLVERPSHGKQGKRSFVVSEHAFSMRNSKRDQRFNKRSQRDNVLPLEKSGQLRMEKRKSSSSNKDSMSSSSDTSTSYSDRSSASTKQSPKVVIVN